MGSSGAMGCTYHSLQLSAPEVGESRLVQTKYAPSSISFLGGFQVDPETNGMERGR